MRIVAVTKGFGAEAVRAALAAGLTDIGENYADELVAKAGDGGRRPRAVLSRPVWHFLGPCSGTRWPGWPRWWHGGRRVAGSKRDGPSPDAPRVRPCWSRWTWPACPGGAAARPTEVPGLVGALRDEDLDVAGLMAVGTARAARGVAAGIHPGVRPGRPLDLPVRSMGMSDDLEVALSEGSTMVRVGRALFGAAAGTGR